jgi:cytochrome b6-f complex iron-sulfur subunit
VSRKGRVSAFVDAILRDRRPPRFDASADEAELLRAASALRGGRPEADLPTADFVSALERRLRRTVDSEQSSRPLVDRRRFLAGAGIAAAAAVTAVGTERVVVALRDDSGSPQGSRMLVPESATWQPVATVADVRRLGAVRFTAGAVQGYALVATDGSIDAVSAICTHMGCVVNYNAGRNRLDCPCHGATFQTDGTPNTRDYSSPLPALPRLQSRISGDHVEVLA